MVYTTKTLEKMIAFLRLRFPVAELSQELGYSRGAVSNYINGKKPISEAFIQAIEQNYGIKAEDFIDGAVPIRGQLSLSRTKEIAVFIAENQDKLMEDPLFKTVVESLFLRDEITRLRAKDS